MVETAKTRAWPYDWHGVESRLDPALIEAQGRFFLNRALNIERTIAFVGAGTSMAYGRVSWGELGITQVSGIVRCLRPIRTAPVVEQLVNQLAGLEKKVRDGQGDAVILAMQLAEQVWMFATEENTRTALLKEFGLEKKKYRFVSGQNIFRYLIKSQTYDETAHICGILRNSFESSKSASEMSDFGKYLRRVLSKRKLSRYHSSHTEWKTDKIFVKRLLDIITNSFSGLTASGRAEDARKLGDRLSAVLGSIGTAGSVFERQQDHGFVAPYHYYAFGTQLDLLRFVANQTGDSRAPLKAEAFIRKQNADKASAKPERQRSAVIHRDCDPLWILVERLEITRFATTNYDLEIERLLSEIGFRKTEYETQRELRDEDVERIGPMGGRLREIVLNERNAVDLIDFATTNSPYSLQVVHLHGRATEQETQDDLQDEVVVTVQDYQRRYLGDSPYKITSREGFQVMFGGNPILFVGIGLAEGDVMRPLREFVGDRVRRNNSIFALRNASESRSERDSFVIDQFIRHGVYVIYYGFCDSSINSDTIDYRYPWLEKFEAYARSVTDTIDRLIADWTADEKKITALFESSIERIRGRQRDFAEQAFPEGMSPASFKSDGADCDIEFECRFLDEISRFICDQVGSDPVSWAGKDHDTQLLFSSVLRNAVTRTQNAVLVKALSACLRGLEKGWRAWADSWLMPPKGRACNLRYAAGDHGPDPTLSEGLPSLQPTRWFRHFIADSAIDWNEKDVPVETFMKALRSLAVVGHRRVFLVTGPRGVGKGSWFLQLAKMGDFILEPDAFLGDAGRPPRKRYAGQFFVNFSFSSEIASVWDALTAFLIDPQCDVSATRRKKPEWDESAGRLERLRTALSFVGRRAADTAAALRKDLEAQDVEIADRYLIVFQAFDLLFEGDGYPKNAEIREICNLLFGTAFASAPLDIVLIFNDAYTPMYFRSKDTTPISTGASDDRRKKCEVQALQLIADEAVLDRAAERSHIASIVNNAGIELVGASVGPNALLRDLLPQPRTPSPESSSYLFVIPRTSSDDKPTSGIQPRVSRYHGLLESIVRSDKEGRKRKEFVTGDFEFVAHGYDSSDDFLSRVMDYWYGCEFAAAIDEPASKVQSELSRLWAGERYDPGLARVAGDAQLHELLIRHLAVISVPVEPDVLAECRGVAKRVTELRVAPAQTIPLIRHALALLWMRGLVFIVHKGVPAGAEKRATERYQVHRSVQLHVYRKLGSQNVEPARSYFFSISLYASQTKELPSLTANAYAFLHDLVDGLVAYPSLGPDRERSRQLTGRCLRAALGISRTLFSIGVVARFADYGRVAIPLPPRSGYFEHHRLVLGWMLRQAAVLSKEAAAAQHQSGGAGASLSDPEPFYGDEIIWLLNEIGVFSLAQGQCYDAVALLEAAKLQALSIEGEAGGPISRRILVNLGICAIHRGRPNEARELLGKVERASEEDETVRMIAHGYLGVLDHLSGSTELALRRYETAIDRLSELGRNRPVSVFRRHRGELHRHRRDFEAAEKDFVAAIDRARQAGYEDMATFAVVARARMHIARSNAADFKEVARTLDAAERYADAMDLPSLKCEISFVHAKLLLKQGETAIAGEKAIRALRIATLNGLVLRSVAYRELLADIYLERGWLEQAKRMRLQVVQAAKNTGYQLITQGAFDRK